VFVDVVGVVFVYMNKRSEKRGEFERTPNSGVTGKKKRKRGRQRNGAVIQK